MRRLFFSLFACAAISAETVITTGEKVQGKVLSIEDQRVVVRLASGEQVSLVKENILAIYDDEGREIWKSPTIVENDPTPDRGANSTVLGTYERLPRWELELLLGGGLMSSSAWFSKFPLGARGDYDYSLHGQVGIMRNIDRASAITISAGFSERNMTATGLAVDGIYGVAQWPVKYVDMRFGYRVRQDWLFLEGGLLQTICLGTVPITIDSGTRRTTLTDARADLTGFLGFYLTLGASFPIFSKYSLVTAFRYEHGLTSAVKADVATQTGYNNAVISSAPMQLIPWNVSAFLGVSFPLQ